MKESKFSYTALRIYNQDLAKSLEEAYDRAETSFATNRSAFLTHLVELGLGVYMSEINAKRQNDIGTAALKAPKDIECLSELIEEYIKYSRTSNERSDEKLDVCETLSSAILNILLASLEGEFVDKEAADSGQYDELPKRFKKGSNKA